ncbi:uncharacterized protein LOC107041160 [Diachasma alloeum]|uniref:uncharacterized protein LOC107041160 n=1 Tax=Diachasma alloeum TaxID=454923 RepID=UPI0007381D3C|nr:uncharacterized protein LOC107041160 [Diachasma alloeum]
MKTLAVLGILGLALGVSSNVQGECPPFYGEARPPGWTSPHKSPVAAGTQVEHHCAIHTCNEDGSWSSRGCGAYTCRDQIGYKDYDYSKAFPLCCPRPICQSDLQ